MKKPPRRITPLAVKEEEKTGEPPAKKVKSGKSTKATPKKTMPKKTTQKKTGLKKKAPTSTVSKPPPT